MTLLTGAGSELSVTCTMTLSVIFVSVSGLVLRLTTNQTHAMVSESDSQGR